MLDCAMNPWILEANLSPSLATDSPLDFDIKSNLVTDLFNLVGVRKNQQKNARRAPNSNKKTPGAKVMRGLSMEQSPTTSTGDASPLARRYTKGVGKDKQKIAPQFYEGVECSILDKISKISAKHRAILLEFLSETERNVRLNFTRVYPGPDSDYYDKFFAEERPLNKLCHKYLFKPNELSPLIEQSKFNDLAGIGDVDKSEVRVDMSVPTSPRNKHIKTKTSTET